MGNQCQEILGPVQTAPDSQLETQWSQFKTLRQSDSGSVPEQRRHSREDTDRTPRPLWRFRCQNINNCPLCFFNNRLIQENQKTKLEIFLAINIYLCVNISLFNFWKLTLEILTDYVQIFCQFQDQTVFKTEGKKNLLFLFYSVKHFVLNISEDTQIQRVMYSIYED